MTNDPIVQKAAQAIRMSMANTSFRKRRPRSKRASPTDPFYQENRVIEITIFPVQMLKMIDYRRVFADFLLGLCKVCTVNLAESRKVAAPRPEKGIFRSLVKVFPAGA